MPFVFLKLASVGEAVAREVFYSIPLPLCPNPLSPIAAAAWEIRFTDAMNLVNMVFSAILFIHC